MRIKRSLALLPLVALVAAVGFAQPVTPPPGQGAPKVLVPPVPIPTVEAPSTPVAEREWADVFFADLRIAKKDAILLSNGRVKPTRVLGRIYELVRQDDEYYYVRNLPVEDPESPLHKAWLRDELSQIRAQMKTEYLQDKYLVVDKPDLVPAFTEQLSFVRRDEGLPHQGRWQMSFDVADMNGDGLPDLVIPPPRLGEEHPFIVLQQKDGSWKNWDAVKWPKDVKFDYGAVRVADFDGDGHLDIAIACHFGPTYVLYGDGKGDFTRWVQLPRVSGYATSRSIVVADFNRDGRPDVATLAEMNLDQASNQRISAGLVNVALNLPSGWVANSNGFSKHIHGDWLSAADIDGDGWTDLLLTSRNIGVTDVVVRNVGKGEKFEPIAALQMPVSSYILSNAVGSLDRFPNPDMLLCFEQFDPWTETTPAQACVVYHFHDAAGKPSLKPTAELLFKVAEEYHNVKGAAIGDINGDGRNDIAVITNRGKIRVFLQQADGRFFEERSKDLDTGGADLFDVKIVDLNHDGKGEIVVMGSPNEQLKSAGGIWVFSPQRLGEKARKAGT